MSAPLSADETHRYARHLTLPQVGPEGQVRLKRASVLVVGAGGLGSPVALYLAAAGVGRLTIVDFDIVDLTNLQRQVLHATSAIGTPKVDSAIQRLSDLNPHVELRAVRAAMSVENARQLVREHDLVIDGTDNFPTRYLVSDACVFERKPYVYGSVFRFEGQAAVFDAEKGGCYRCLYPAPPPPGAVPSCEEGGVLGVVPGIIGLVQATEAIKLILGIGETLTGRLLLLDALTMRFRQITLPKVAGCPICGDTPTITTLREEEFACETEKEEEPMPDITPAELSERISKGDKPRLVDVREPFEWNICHIEGATLIPLAQLEQKLDELPRDEEIIVYCRSGARSARAAEFMRGRGFANVRNLLGGVNRWAVDVDPSMRRY
jgi:molybdopterin/thiamine biosynthesis adenylyltransferase/rhodanese-related sulfurtransferase